MNEKKIITKNALENELGQHIFKVVPSSQLPPTGIFPEGIEVHKGTAYKRGCRVGVRGGGAPGGRRSFRIFKSNEKV